VRHPAAAALLPLLAVAACSRGGEPASDAAWDTPHRIAVMAPAAAEILAGFGLADRVVAVGDFVDWPPEMAVRERIGAYDAPNLERLLSLRVDLLLTARSAAAAAAHERIRRAGIPVVELDTDTFDGALDAFVRAGTAVGRVEEGRAAAARVEARLEEVRRRTEDLPPRRVLYVAGSRPLYGAGPGSHIDRLIETAGGVNVLADAAGPYPLVSLETVLERLPEVIVDVSDNRPQARRGRFPGAWGEWNFLPAVAQNRVWWVHPDRLAVPGPRLGEMAELLARLIHPETFGPPGDGELGPLREDGHAP
jgi:iron complex transport system substrate-binding protein